MRVGWLLVCVLVVRRYWLSVGAQPSEPVARLLGQAGIIPTPPERPRTEKFVDMTKGKNIRKTRLPK
jgi:ribosomal protein S16